MSFSFHLKLRHVHIHLDKQIVDRLEGQHILVLHLFLTVIIFLLATCFLAVIVSFLYMFYLMLLVWSQEYSKDITVLTFDHFIIAAL